MSKKSRRGGAGSRYYLGFGVTALLLVSCTLVLVLVVLPQRYVFGSGFRESGLSFPDPGVPFVPPDAVQIAAHVGWQLERSRPLENSLVWSVQCWQLLEHRAYIL